MFFYVCFLVLFHLVLFCFACGCPAVPAPFVASLLFLYWIGLAYLSEISWLYLCGLFLGSLLCSIDLFVYSCASTTLSWFSSVQSLSHVQLFATPWTAALQASLSISNSQSLPKLMSIESVMPSNHLILCRPLCLPPSIFSSLRVFSSESVLRIRWPDIGVSASASVLQWIFRTDFL